MNGRVERAALAAAAMVALALPAALLWPRAVPASLAEQARPLGAAPAPPPLAAVYSRPLFASAAPAEAVLPADAPVLVGVVGRLGSDAVAMVRTPNASRTLVVGEGIEGWRLESLSADAAFFTRGTQRARVPMPATE